MMINYVELKNPITPINQDHSNTFLSDIESAGGFHLEKSEIGNFSQSDFCVIFIIEVRPKVYDAQEVFIYQINMQ